MNNRKTGLDGERIAAELLTRKGYEILERNYSTGIAEADIIARKGNTLVFVEVKARESTRFGTPAEAVTPYKRRKYVVCAEQYRASKRLTKCDIRFDVIAILRGEAEHIENAFDVNDAAAYIYRK